MALPRATSLRAAFGGIGLYFSLNFVDEFSLLRNSGGVGWQNYSVRTVSSVSENQEETDFGAEGVNENNGISPSTRVGRVSMTSRSEV